MNYEEYTVRIYEDGTKYYYQNNLCHRTDGPAIEWSNGKKEYYKNGLRHRTDGPAVEYSDGTKFYYQNDKLHRLDGPAIEWNDGTKEYFIKGKKLSEEEFKKRTNNCHNKTIEIDGKKYKLVLED